MENRNDTYYSIYLSYEIPYDALNDPNEDVVNAKSILCDRIINGIPEDKYLIFSSSIVTYQLPDNCNCLVTYSSYFKSNDGLPMEEYVLARNIKDKIKEEFEEFFSAIDCEFKSLNIKPLK